MDSEKYTHIVAAEKFSRNNLLKIREGLAESLKSSDFSEKITVVATGSYGRLEASESSDLDLFVFFDSDKPAEVIEKECASIKEVIDRYIKKQPGDTGTFGHNAVVLFSEMLINIGGERDTNKNLTRRMLFLLEGTWLYGEKRYENYRKNLIEKYISPMDPSGKPPGFFLNDIIRYYRTIATDFQYKVAENGKSWGLRNVKLRFSRKLLYFGGIVAAAELTQVDPGDRANVLNDILSESVLARIERIGAENSATNEVMALYDRFLAVLENPDVREKLSKVKREERNQSEEFDEMRQKSRSLSVALERWLRQQYPDSACGEPHPIHNSLIF